MIYGTTIKDPKKRLEYYDAVCPKILAENERLLVENEQLKCCGNCEHWLHKYEECEHPRQSQDNFDMKLSTDVCNLWEMFQDNIEPDQPS
jgi:hypothetical protein